MPIQDLIKFFRQSVMVQDPEVSVVDEDFLTMSDEDFINLFNVCLTKVNPEENIYSMTEECIFPLMLVAKKELFYRLAIKSSPSYSLTSATGVALKRSEVFDHYYQLIQQIDKEYESYISTGGIGIGGMSPSTGNILLSSRYFSQRNYNLASRPTIRLSLDNIYSDKIELSWRLTKINKFAKYVVYIGKSPIIDIYKNNSISTSARNVLEIKDIHNTHTRIEDLEANTEYYVLVLAEERNGLQGYAELKFTTLE